VRALASHQLAVQSGLVQRARDEPPDDQQQLDIAVGEFASLDRVHVQHADQAAGIGLHRNRDHRGEVRSAQRLERHVTGIGLFVVADDHRFAVAGHPSGDALAQRQPDLADLGVERRCRTGQRQRPVGVVEHVTKHTSLAVAAVIIRAAAAARGSTPGPLDAAWINSRSRASSRSASTRSRTGSWAGRASGVSLIYPLPQRGWPRTVRSTHSELAEDRAEMTLDGLDADDQLGGDGTVDKAR
jgi:hypothetical protein